MLAGADVEANSMKQEQRNEVERMKGKLGLTEEKRIRKGKKNPKCDQYPQRCRPGRNAWETLLDDFRKLIPSGEEWAKGK